MSVERKKTKTMRGIAQKATSERPSRNSYTGKKLTRNKTIH